MRAGRSVIISVTADISVQLITGFPELLVDRGWQVHVVTSAGPNSASLSRNTPVHVHGLTMKREPAPLHDARSWWEWRSLLRAITPLAVMVATPKAAFLALTAARVSGVPVRIHLLYGLRLETSKGLRRRVLSLLEQLTMRAATSVLAVSPSLAERAIELGLTERSRIRVLGAGSANGVDLEQFSSSPAVENKTEPPPWLDDESGAITVGFVGRLARDKGVSDLVTALHMISTKASVRLLVVGVTEDEPLVAELDSLQAVGVPVHRTGGVDDVAPWLRQMAFLVLPSYREGLPTVLIEAAATGLPVISTDIVGSRDAVIDGETGILVPPRDPGALADAILLLAQDSTLRARMGGAGRRHVEKLFDRSVVQDLYASELDRQAKEAVLRCRRKGSP